jgi:hypothetical protein
MASKKQKPKTINDEDADYRSSEDEDYAPSGGYLSASKRLSYFLLMIQGKVMVNIIATSLYWVEARGKQFWEQGS